MKAYKIEGNKYQETKNFSIKEIAALIRKESREAAKPYGVKVSVILDNYSGGCAIHTFLNCPADKNGKELRKKLEDIRTSYNFDNSDSMTDYFHVRYYGGTSF
jgi:LmbE family N-acetylglucosaminyl deacetylase